MNRLKLLLAAAIIAIAGAMPASAQFKIGPRLGVTVNSLHFNRSVFDSDNRAGFTGGLMCEFTVPLIGVGMDLSAMYVRRSVRFMIDKQLSGDTRDYIAIPLNLKWKFKLPLVRPFLTTGPELAILTSGRKVDNRWNNRRREWAWNFGAGLEILGHLQVAASYGIGISKSLTGQTPDGGSSYDAYNAKARVWTVTAAYLF